MSECHSIRRKLKKAVTGTLLCAMMLGAVQGVQASELSEAKAKKAEAEENLEDTNARIEEIEAEQAELQAQIDELDASLVQILVEINTTQDDIAAKQAELDAATIELDAAQAAEDEYYVSMKLRIQYMYENGDVSMLEAILTSENFADVLNKVDMYDELYEADRELLDGYIEAKEQVEAIVDEIQAEEEELEDMEQSLEEQQAELESELASRQIEFDDYDEKLAEAEDLAEQYQSTISEMNNIISTMNSPDTVVYLDSGTSSEKGDAVIEFASQFVGNPYVWGGTSLTNGCDCSGFVQQVYAHFGVSLPHYSGALRSVGYAVSTSDMQPGDIVCYEGHVGLYAGNGQLLNASNSKPYPQGGIKYSDVYYKNIICVRRIFA